MRILGAALAASVAMIATPALATTVVVDAKANSTNGGVSKDTGLTFSGDTFKIHSLVNDLWSSGELPRFSDADGIVYRKAVAGDDSGLPPGTVIGIDYGNYSQGGATAHYGTLVADLGNGVFQALGANGTFTLASSGPLKLAYLDSNNGDNTGSITFKISAVPEPATWAMLILGMGAVGVGLRTRRRGHAFAAA